MRRRERSRIKIRKGGSAPDVADTDGPPPVLDPSASMTRREFLRDAATAAAAIGAGALALRTHVSARGAEPVQAADRADAREEPYAGNWATWVLRSGSEVRVPPPAPAVSPRGATELAQLEQAQLERTQDQINAARFWDTGPATRRWTELCLEMIQTHRPNPPRAARGLALVHVAMYDALVAAWHAKHLFNYPAPASVDSEITPAVRPRNTPSYPSEHAVAAGAASEVLKYLFPRQGSAWFEAKAKEASASRIWAGVDWPSAVEQGLILGRTVADRVVARAAADGSDAAWDGKRVAGACSWRPTPPGFVYPPLEPGWGKVTPWLLMSASARRPGPPSQCGSADERDQYLEVYRTGEGLTEEQKKIALFWNDAPGTFTPPGHWFDIALGQLKRFNINTPRAARIGAYLGVVVMDTSICVWDCKYAYWSVRPITYIRDHVDPNWTSLITTPPFPGYVSGHSAFSAGAAEWLGYTVPSERAAVRSLAAEAALSRLYGGIHTRGDNATGAAMGKLLGALVSARALGDDVEDLVGRGALDRRRGDSLRATLDAAVTSANQKNMERAIGGLRAFVGQVEAALGPQDAGPLSTSAREILAQFAAAI